MDTFSNKTKREQDAAILQYCCLNYATMIRKASSVFAFIDTVNSNLVRYLLCSSSLSFARIVSAFTNIRKEEPKSIGTVSL